MPQMSYFIDVFNFCQYQCPSSGHMLFQFLVAPKWPGGASKCQKPITAKN
jgi:hypothetical protein